MRRLALLLATLLLSSCGQGSTVTAARDIPPELIPLSEFATACMADTKWTHVERSEHCVVVAETIFDKEREECEQARSYECLNWKLAKSDIFATYQTAIVQSLHEHGKSEEMKMASDGEWWLSVYFNGEFMRRLFNECLVREEEALREVSLQQITSIIDRPLADGQLCFRAGYPELKDTEERSS